MPYKWVEGPPPPDSIVEKAEINESKPIKEVIPSGYVP